MTARYVWSLTDATSLTDSNRNAALTAPVTLAMLDTTAHLTAMVTLTAALMAQVRFLEQYPVFFQD
jgi:hypothetical protein